LGFVCLLLPEIQSGLTRRKIKVGDLVFLLIHLCKEDNVNHRSGQNWKVNEILHKLDRLGL
jgi:hypothetical protein